MTSAPPLMSLPLGKSLLTTYTIGSTYTTASGPSSPPPPAAPLPELPPTHEAPLNILTPTFVPKPPRLPSVKVTKPPSESDIEHNFEDLIAILNELSADGGSEPQFSSVFSLWRDRKPDAIESFSAAQFKAYLQRAESAGIVSIQQHPDGDGWVTLRHQQNTNSDSPFQHAAPQEAGSRFRDLIQILNKLRLAGDPEPQFSVVGPRLLGKKPSVYWDAGVKKFEEYVRAATDAGVVTVLGVKNGDGSLKLCPVYCGPPWCSSASTRIISIPPTRTASTASPFAPLLEFLNSKQLTNSQPISFSEVYSHLVSTYPDLVALCTGVPGVTTFGQYIDEAIASGLISLVRGTTISGDALISLRVGLLDGSSPPPRLCVPAATLPSSPLLQETTVPSPPANVTPSSFRALVAVLTELQTLTGESAFWFSSVAPLLLKRRPNVYASVGVATFVDYVTLAVENGVASTGETEQGGGWVSLSDSMPGGPAVSPGPPNHRRMERPLLQPRPLA